MLNKILLWESVLLKDIIFDISTQKNLIKNLNSIYVPLKIYFIWLICCKLIFI